jgi:hypothetical protein
MEPLAVAGLVREEVSNFFENLRETMKLQNDHMLAILALLPENERTQYLLTTQSVGMGAVLNLMENTFGVINSIVDANVPK